MTNPPKSSASKRTREMRPKKLSAAQRASEANKLMQYAVRTNGPRPTDLRSPETLPAPKAE